MQKEKVWSCKAAYSVASTNQNMSRDNPANIGTTREVMQIIRVPNDLTT